MSFEIFLKTIFHKIYLVHSWILFPIWKLVWWGKVDQLSKISLMYAKIFQAYKLENLLLIFQSFFLWGHHQNPEEDFSIIINKNVESLEDTSIKFYQRFVVIQHFSKSSSRLRSSAASNPILSTLISLICERFMRCLWCYLGRNL